MVSGATGLVTELEEGGPSITSDSNQAGAALTGWGRGVSVQVSYHWTWGWPGEHQFITFAQDPSTNPLAVWRQ